MATVNSPLLADALRDRYVLERELGRGGMATVFLARDLRHDRQVALKVLHPELAATLGPERFQREIRLAARLQHPHILTVHDSGETAGQLWFTMPLVEGESLRDRLRRETQLPVEDALRIATDAARALQYAHDHGVVHRDIKPENLLLTKDGSTLVADFGIARALDTAGIERLTETGLSLGTPTYMSPEQASGERTVDARSDQYSLACVLYEMLAGEPPFTGPTAQAVIARRVSGEVPPLRRVRPSVPESVEHATLRALAPVPADRFPDAAAFAQAIASATPPQNAVPAATTVIVRPPIRARRRIGGLIGGALVLAAFAAVWHPWRHPTRAAALLRVGDRGGTTQRPAGTSDGEAHRPTVIAVLPFENLGPADDEYFAAGMTDEITSRLAAVSGLGLVPSRAVQRYARTNMTMREIGRELGIDYLLVGSVRWAGADSASKSVRITLELLRAKDERQLWATTYDREITDIFKVQSDIAEQVIERLGVTMLEGERNRLSARPTENHEAYILYLKGRYFWNKRTEADIQTALDYFQRAVDLDPGYSRAWVGIADVWIFRGGTAAWRHVRPSRRPRVPRSGRWSSTARWRRRTLRWRKFSSSSITTGRLPSASIVGQSSSTPTTRPHTTGTGGFCRRWVGTTKRCNRR